MKLSPHFQLAEFVQSQTASRHSIDNDPPAHILPKLATLAAGMEQVRTLLKNKPISISSGYRGPVLNAIIKGSKHSQHMTGEACDFVCPAYGTPKDIVKAIVNSNIAYDQVIQEFFSSSGGGWVHISFSDRGRKQALIIDSTGTRAYA